MCLVAGWGYVRTGGGTVDELREVNVSIINPEVCRERWPVNIPHNIICAGGYDTDKGFCQVCFLSSKRKWQLVSSLKMVQTFN